MNKSFYMYMSVQGRGHNVFACLIVILLLASCQSYKLGCETTTTSSMS